MRDLLRSRLFHLAIASGIVALDRVTKALVVKNLSFSDPVTVVPGFVDLTYVRNPGGVFGMFRDIDAGVRTALFTFVPIAAIVLILVYAYRAPAAHRATQIALALILGGAVGNLVDRLSLGYVIDFLDVHWGAYHWPAFNVADSAICAGVGLLLFEGLFSRDTPPEPDRGENAS